MSLTHDHRQMLFEVFCHGRCPREAATALGIPEGMVKSRMFHALRALGTATATATAIGGAEAVRRVAAPGRIRGTRAPPAGELALSGCGAATVAQPIRRVGRVRAQAGFSSPEAACDATVPARAADSVEVIRWMRTPSASALRPVTGCCCGWPGPFRMT
jgi:hypothetical protein